MRAIIALAAFLCAANFAWAADLPVAPAPQAPAVYLPPAPPPYSWTGIYFGVNGGGTFAHASDTATITGGLAAGSASGSGSANGGVFGGQIGFNYQINQLVLGMEGDFDWSSVSSTSTFGILSETSKVDWLATIRGRAGFAIDRVMIYGTGGVAFVPTSDNVTATGFGTIFNASSTNVGWTVGAGAEAAFAQNWTARVEYLFVDSKFTLNGPLALVGGNGTINGTLTDSIIRAGVNFKYP